MDSQASPMKIANLSKYVTVRVTFLDDSVQQFHVSTRALGQHLYNQVISKLQLIESDYFDLEYVNKEGVQCWLDHLKLIVKQSTQNKEYIYTFGIKFYPPFPNMLEDEYTRYLFALQIKRDIYQGHLQCNMNTAALLLAFIAQSEIGDFLEDEYLDFTYLSALRLTKQTSEEFLVKVMECHKTLIGQSPSEADYNLLDTARKVESYGMRLHVVRDSENLPLRLAVSHQGIIIYLNRLKVNTFSWAKVRKLSFKRKHFFIKLHTDGYFQENVKEIVEFIFNSRNECKNFWKKCIEHHAFFRCQSVKQSGKRRHRVLSKGSSFRYTGRTQKQLQDCVRESNIRRPQFERSQSMGRVTMGGGSHTNSLTPRSPASAGILQRFSNNANHTTANNYRHNHHQQQMMSGAASDGRVPSLYMRNSTNSANACIVGGTTNNSASDCTTKSASYHHPHHHHQCIPYPPPHHHHSHQGVATGLVMTPGGMGTASSASYTMNSCSARSRTVSSSSGEEPPEDEEDGDVILNTKSTADQRSGRPITPHDNQMSNQNAQRSISHSPSNQNQSTTIPNIQSKTGILISPQSIIDQSSASSPLNIVRTLPSGYGRIQGQQQQQQSIMLLGDVAHEQIDPRINSSNQSYTIPNYSELARLMTSGNSNSNNANPMNLLRQQKTSTLPNPNVTNSSNLSTSNKALLGQAQHFQNLLNNEELNSSLTHLRKSQQRLDDLLLATMAAVGVEEPSLVELLANNKDLNNSTGDYMSFSGHRPISNQIPTVTMRNKSQQPTTNQAPPIISPINSTTSSTLFHGNHGDDGDVIIQDSMTTLQPKNNNSNNDDNNNVRNSQRIQINNNNNQSMTSYPGYIASSVLGANQNTDFEGYMDPKDLKAALLNELKRDKDTKNITSPAPQPPIRSGSSLDRTRPGDQPTLPNNISQSQPNTATRVLSPQQQNILDQLHRQQQQQSIQNKTQPPPPDLLPPNHNQPITQSDSEKEQHRHNQSKPANYIPKQASAKPIESDDDDDDDDGRLSRATSGESRFSVAIRDQSLNLSHGGSLSRRSSTSSRSRSHGIRKHKVPLDKSYYIIKEILNTERTYMKTLDIICIWFRKAVASGNVTDPNCRLSETLSKKIFNLLDPIHEQHSQLLRDLETRVQTEFHSSMSPYPSRSNSKSNLGLSSTDLPSTSADMTNDDGSEQQILLRRTPSESGLTQQSTAPVVVYRVGDIFLRSLCIIPMYKQYIESVEDILLSLNVTLVHNKSLRDNIRKFEAQKICFLPLFLYFLSPAHRILQYRLSLEKLLRQIGDAHSDTANCKLVLSQIQDLIQSQWDNYKRAENTCKLLELQRDIIGFNSSSNAASKSIIKPSSISNTPQQSDSDNTVTLSIGPNNCGNVSGYSNKGSIYEPHRQFIREGWLQKLGKKGYQPRMFFIFSDQLIYANKANSHVLQFKVHGQFALSDLMIEESQPTHSFTVYSGNRCFLAAANSQWQRDRWLEDVSRAVLGAKSSWSLLHGDGSGRGDTRDVKGRGGNSETSGYDNDKTDQLSSGGSIDERYQIPQRSNTSVYVCWHRNWSLSFTEILRANENELSGFLLRKFKNSNGWQKLWVVFMQLCLFFYKSHQDDSPLATLPLLGYLVSLPTPEDQIRKDFVFKIQFKNHVYFFRGDCQYTFERWMEVLSTATGSTSRLKSTR